MKFIALKPWMVKFLKLRLRNSFIKTLSFIFEGVLNTKPSEIVNIYICFIHRFQKTNWDFHKYIYYTLIYGRFDGKRNILQSYPARAEGLGKYIIYIMLNYGNKMAVSRRFTSHLANHPSKTANGHTSVGRQTKTILVRRARQSGDCWRSKNELLSNVLS